MATVIVDRNSPRRWLPLVLAAPRAAFAGLTAAVTWGAVAGVAFLLAIFAYLKRSGRASASDRATRRDGVNSAKLAEHAVTWRVEVIAIPGLTTETNLRDDRFQRFLKASGPSEEETSTHRKPSNQGQGPPRLVGRWGVVSMFVGFDGRPWSDSEVAGRLRSVRDALQWIAAQAERRGVPLELELIASYFQTEDDTDASVEVGFVQEGDDVGPSEANAETQALVAFSRGALRLGFRDGPHLVEQVQGWLPGRKLAWVVHLRRAGRSLAIPWGMSQLPGVNIAVCHAAEASFTEPVVKLPAPRAETYAHELLHLFGASDKYGVAIGRYQAGQVSNADIMRLDSRRLDHLSIDPLTAWEIGWSSWQARRTSRGS